MNTINWEDSSWKYLSLVGGEEVVSLSHAKVYVFSDSVLCLGKMHQNPQSNTVWEDKLTWFKGEPMEYFPRIHNIAALQQSQRVPIKNEQTARIIHRTMENRNESVNKDNSHTWVRISHGLNKLVTD